MDRYNWHPWFAWFPVATNDGTWAFWRRIERMHTAPAYWMLAYSPYPEDREGYWVYREPRSTDTEESK